MKAPLESGERLDVHLVRMRLARSRRDARELIASGNVLLNGRQARKGAAVATGDRVELLVNRAPEGILPDFDTDIAVLYQDRDIIVVNKPGLIPCHPLRPGERATLMNAVIAHFPEAAEAGDKPLEGGLVHRLDNGTSGALLIALTPEAFVRMRSAIRSGTIARTYHALLAGVITGPLEISQPIAHKRKNARKMAPLSQHPSRRAHIRGARPAATSVTPLERLGPYTLAAITPRTGRRHQIRVHLAAQGVPLAGDLLYGGARVSELAEGRFWLHLARLEFDSPLGARIVEAPLPNDLNAVLERLRSSQSHPG